MTKKFDVNFSSSTKLFRSYVYISPSSSHTGMFSVGILHPTAATGTFQSKGGITKQFDLKQNLVSSEAEAVDWATQWLSQEAGCPASLTEVIKDDE